MRPEHVQHFIIALCLFITAACGAVILAYYIAFRSFVNFMLR